MKSSEHTFTSWDGVRLFYRSWLPPVSCPKKALLLFHRGHEHSGRWQETVDSLGLEDVAIFAWDARGHGRSPGERGAAESVAAVVRDVDDFVRHVAKEHQIPIEHMILIAHSLGAVHVAAWVHDYAPPIRGMVLVTAAFRVKLYVPLAIPALRLRERFFGRGYVKSYVKARMLTHDAEQAAQYESDPLIFRQIATNLLIDLHDTGRRLMADAGAIHTPTLMLGTGKDWVVSLNAQRKFFDRLSSPIKRMHTFPGAYHALFHESQRYEVIRYIRDFLQERFAQPATFPFFLNGDRTSHTWKEYERLKQGHARAKFALARAGLKTVGRLSRGIDLGWRAGFDSGLSLDYVYANQPRGTTPVGRLIDKSYLNSPGWRGIRQRKQHLQEALLAAIEEIHKEGRPVRLLDIAAGAGRYVLETIRARPGIPVSVTLRDYKQENIEAGQALTKEFDLENVTIERGDAFDSKALQSIAPRVTIGIVSGLYELFPENEMVLKSLAGLADAIEPDGFLIYTNQPWHPQLEFIASVLRNREGDKWIMRRRTTAEIDQMIHACGFEKVAMKIDQWGMFTVSTARKRQSEAME